MIEKELFYKYNCYPRQLVNKYQLNKDDLFNYLTENTLEFKHPNERNFKINKFVLYLHGTYNCNSNCNYCINQQLRKDYNGKIIDDETIINIVEKLGPYLIKIIWHGGEPLLIPEEKMILLEETKKKNNFYFPTSLQTNLINMTEEKKSFLKSINVGWGTSFDGISNTCNRGENSTAAFLNEKKINPNLSCLSVITNKEINELINNYNYMKKLGVKRFTTSLVRENIENSNQFLLKNAEKDATAIYDYIKYWIFDKNPIIDNFIINKIENIFGNVHQCQDNFSIAQHFIIDPYGNINLCAHNGLKDKIININEIKNVENDFIKNGNLAKELHLQFQLLQKCQEKKCPIYYCCHGGCMGENYSKTKYQKLDENFCNFNLILYDKLYELLENIDISSNEYNPRFKSILQKNNYFSIKEIKERSNINNDNN